MTTDNWYRNTTWNSAIEADFEARLKCSRGTFYKAQYLRIQSFHLLGSPDAKIQLEGVKQAERLISEFPNEEFSVILGQEELGDYYLKTNNLEKAAECFKIVVDHCENKKSRHGTSAKADLKLAEVILTANWTNKLNEAYHLCKNYPVTELVFHNDQFYYTELTAHICDKLKKHEEARDFARKAIEISKITEAQFYRHKTLGLVKATDDQLRTLEQIAND